MQIVIDIPDEVYNFTKNRGHLPYGVNIAGRIIDGTPLPQGEWIQATDEEGIEIYRKILCSRCNEASVEKYSFCPNCGAQMKGGARGRSK